MGDETDRQDLSDKHNTEEHPKLEEVVVRPGVIVVGAPGETGDKGEQGTKGDTGERGVRGDDGIRGDTGLQGEPGTYVVGRLVLDTLVRVEHKVDGTNLRMDGLTIRMDNLVEGTNHRLDDFRTAMSDRDRDTDRSFGLMDQHIALKADKDELLTSWGLRMLNNRFLRWGLGILFAAIVGTATFEHWWAWAFHR